MREGQPDISVDTKSHLFLHEPSEPGSFVLSRLVLVHHHVPAPVGVYLHRHPVASIFEREAGRAPFEQGERLAFGIEHDLAM